MNKINQLFNTKLNVINVGIATFFSDLKTNNTEVLQVNFRPPAGGDKKVLDLLSKFKKK